MLCLLYRLALLASDLSHVVEGARASGVEDGVSEDGVGETMSAAACQFKKRMAGCNGTQVRGAEEAETKYQYQ